MLSVSVGDWLLHWQPVKQPEKWCNVGLTFALSGQVVLSPLQNVEGGERRTVQHGVAVVKPGCHDAARHYLGQVVRQQTAHVTSGVCVVVARPCYVFGMAV